MLVSHESPLVLLEKSRSYNDYDYCLVHLLSQYPEYLEFFKKSKEMGRTILLDNSMFELREAFDPVEFARWIKELKPDEYIVPDVFSDSEKTIANFESWKKDYSDVPGRKIGVVHGLNYQNMIDCYKYMTQNADKIGISFECKYFHSIGYSLDPKATDIQRLMNGRIKFIRDLIADGVWSWHKPHHLLGCTLPQEFGYYNDTGIFNIESIDTSNPIVNGMHGIKYKDNGLTDKIPTKLADLLETHITGENMEIIFYNIAKFKEINKIR